VERVEDLGIFEGEGHQEHAAALLVAAHDCDGYEAINDVTLGDRRL
jgi:hypothetical protein